MSWSGEEAGRLCMDKSARLHRGAPLSSCLYVNNKHNYIVFNNTNMTTYIPSLTLPAFLFEQPAAAVLLPVAAGTAIGKNLAWKTLVDSPKHPPGFAISPSETKKFHAALRQPPLKPPGWLFGPVWTSLYGMMGYAAYRAWTIGTTSIDPRKVQLARVRCCVFTGHCAALTVP